MGVSESIWNGGGASIYIMVWSFVCDVDNGQRQTATGEWQTFVHHSVDGDAEFFFGSFRDYGRIWLISLW